MLFVLKFTLSCNNVVASAFLWLLFMVYVFLFLKAVGISHVNMGMLQCNPLYIFSNLPHFLSILFTSMIK